MRQFVFDTKWHELRAELDRRLPFVPGTDSFLCDGCLVRMSFTLGSDLVTLSFAAAVPGARGLRLRLKRGWVSPIGRGLGIQDLTTGDEAFDDRIIVKGNDLAYARAWMDGEARARVLAAEDFTYVLKNEIVTATPRALRWEVACFEDAIRAVAALAARGRRLREELAGLAAALGGTLAGDREIALERRGTRALVDVPFERVPGAHDGATKSRRLATRVTVRREGDARDTWTHARWDVLAAAANPETVRVYLDGLVTDPARLLGAIDLTLQLAASRTPPEGGGPYR